MEFFNHLTEDHVAFIAKQPMFFVATAAPGARINVSATPVPPRLLLRGWA
jgi:hypothetical protein